jgi:hypothetical protein
MLCLNFYAYRQTTIDRDYCLKPISYMLIYCLLLSNINLCLALTPMLIISPTISPATAYEPKESKEIPPSPPPYVVSELDTLQVNLPLRRKCK